MSGPWGLPNLIEPDGNGHIPPQSYLRPWPVVLLKEEGKHATSEDDEWETDLLLELVSHDLINKQQAALGYLELLMESKGLSKGDRAVLGRTMEILEQTARLMLQARTAMVQRERGEYRPVMVPLDRSLNAAVRSVQGAFTQGRLRIETSGLDGGPQVMADAMLPEMLTQLIMLLSDRAPPDRECTLRIRVEDRGEGTALSISSEGFALNPMVIDALTGGRPPLGRSSEVATVTMVRQLLRQYGATASMEDSPPGDVGSHLVIELPNGETSDAVDNDSR